MNPIYHSWNRYFKTPFGAVKEDEPVCFRLDLPQKSLLHAPKLLLYREETDPDPVTVLDLEWEKAEHEKNTYRGVLSKLAPGLYFYGFSLLDEQKTVYLNKGYDSEGYLCDQPKERWQLTVYRKDFTVPDFLSRGVMYQIFPDRFYNSQTSKEQSFSDRNMHSDPTGLPLLLEQGKRANDDYFGGDLCGIMQKLSFLQQLGVTVLYLNPIFEAHSNHRYDTADYEKIDPLLGSEQDFEALCREAEKRGIRIVLDGVFNHTGSDSIYFNREGRYPAAGACDSRDSVYFPWYSFEEYPNRYRCWWGVPTLPAVNTENPDYQEFLCGENGIVRKWLRLGAKGFRIDVADELPDSLLDRLRKTVKEEDAENALIGEVWEDASNKISYGKRRRYLQGDQFDSIMNYPLRKAILEFVRDGKGYELFDCMLTLCENYPPQVLAVLMNFLSTHDTVRALNFFCGDPPEDVNWQCAHNQPEGEAYEQAKKLLKLALVLLFTLPGIPCLYYGEEAGLGGYSDPLNRCFYRWDRIDPELVSLVSSLSGLKRQQKALRQAGFIPVCFNSCLAAFERSGDGEKILITVNRSDRPMKAEWAGAYRNGVLLAGSFDFENLVSEPFSFAIFKKQEKFTTEEREAASTAEK